MLTIKMVEQQPSFLHLINWVLSRLDSSILSKEEVSEIAHLDVKDKCKFSSLS